MHMRGKSDILHNIAGFGDGIRENPGGDVAQNGFRTWEMHNVS